ncbi:MAG TPA: PH domain-containing protein [Thermoanaerobaculaceae bacterium]|nr:PH domain-containing protein [Thermoanaerobaculaceae bacterium]
MHHFTCEEFSPKPNRSRWRVFWGVVLTMVTVPPVILVGLLAMSGPSICYEIHGGVLDIRGGKGLLSNHRTVTLGAIRESGVLRLQGGRRVFGTGMPGFCAGRYSYDALGSVWQVTDCRRDVVLLRVEGEALPILVSPPDEARFLAALRERLDGDYSPGRASTPVSWRLFPLLLLIALLPAAAYVPLAAFAAPRRLRYRVANGELEVQLLVFRRRFPLAGRTARRYTPRSAWKVAGSGLPGYFAGSFAVDGQTARVYASVVKSEGVMIEGEPRVFVAPADTEGFLAALQRQGVHLA